MNERIYIVSKKKDHLLQFWKLNKLDYEEDYLLDVLKLYSAGGSHFRMINYSGVAELTLWDKDMHLDLFTNSFNIDGDQIPKPLSEVTLYPMANIKTDEDLEKYNEWRMTEFKNIVRYLQKDFTWRDAYDEPISSMYRDWLKINVDSDILPLKPVEVTFTQYQIDRTTQKVILSNLY